MPRVSRQANIRGIVQGVGFRWAARDAANRLGLHGFIRNLPDGSVEAVFSGSADAVAAFVSWLEKGPPSATVSSVVVDEAAAPDGPGFDIVP